MLFLLLFAAAPARERHTDCNAEEIHEYCARGSCMEKGQTYSEARTMKCSNRTHLSVIEGGKIAVILARVEVSAPVIGLRQRGIRMSNETRIDKLSQQQLT